MLLLASGVPGAARPARAAAPTLALAAPRSLLPPSTRGLAASGVRLLSSNCSTSSTSSSHPLRTRAASRTHTRSNATSLATYELLSTKSLSAVWFQSCVQKLIGKLNSAPFLHVVQSLPLHQEETVALGEHVLKSPEAWSTLSQRLASTDPDALIFVHPVDCAEDVCPARRATRQQACSSPSSCGANMAAAAAEPDVLAGSVGDCCGPSGSGHTHSTALAAASGGLGSAQPAPQQHHHQHRHRQHGRAPEQREQYHGLVIQSPVFRDVEGCYLLKTVTSADRTGCKCTHFTLTKVCAGVPLLTQLQRSWLVGPGA